MAPSAQACKTVNRHTRDRAYALRVLVANTVPVLNHRNVLAHALHKVHDLLQPLDEGLVPRAHVPRPAVHREAADPRVDDALDELQRVLLRRQEANLRRDADLWRHGRAEGGEDRAEQVRVAQQRRTHARVRGEWLRAAAVEVDARDVVHDHARGLHCYLGVRGADLVDEKGLLDGVACEDGFGFAQVGYDTGGGLFSYFSTLLHGN